MLVLIALRSASDYFSPSETETHIATILVELASQCRSGAKQHKYRSLLIMSLVLRLRRRASLVGASLLAIVHAIVPTAARIASNCFRYWRSHNIGISSDNAPWQADVSSPAVRVTNGHCSGFPLSYLVARVWSDSIVTAAWTLRL